MKIVAYYRLSKEKRGKNKEETLRDAYGLEDQRQEVARFVAQHDAQIVGEFKEIITGTEKRVRPELAKAISVARLHNATLVVAKLDRLARNVAFTSALMDSGVDFVCCDNEYANRLTIHILAAVAEDEARRISDRTKRGLRIAKDKGVKLGSARPGHWDGREDRRREGARNGNKASIEARRKKVKEKYLGLIELIAEMRVKNQSFAQIATTLNNLGHHTVRGKPFSKSAVYKLVKLFEIAV